MQAWTKIHQSWVHLQKLADPIAREALVQMLIHLAGQDRQLAAPNLKLAQIASAERWT